MEEFAEVAARGMTLIYGPPGCGKTSVAMRLASRLGGRVMWVPTAEGPGLLAQVAGRIAVMASRVLGTVAASYLSLNCMAVGPLSVLTTARIQGQGRKESITLVMICPAPLRCRLQRRGVGCRVAVSTTVKDITSSSHEFVSYEVWIRKALRFREYAEEDLRSGRYDSAAFFAQQAAEFLLKGVLIKLTGSRPLTHAVSELLAYLTLGSPVPEGVTRCAEALETHCIQARYPDVRLSEGGSGRRRRR